MVAAVDRDCQWQLAAHYAAKKWGKCLAVEKGRIMFQLERELQQLTPKHEFLIGKKKLSR